jgi:hypothetical protein
VFAPAHLAQPEALAKEAQGGVDIADSNHRV